MRARRVASVMTGASEKGGVGRTSVAVNLAVALARLGYRVGLLDYGFIQGDAAVRDAVLRTFAGMLPAVHLVEVPQCA